MRIMNLNLVRVVTGEILTFGKPTINGRIYDSKLSGVFNTEKPVLVYFTSEPVMSEDNYIGFVSDMRVIGDSVCAKIVLNERNSDTVISLLEGGYTFVTAGTGEISDNGVIEEYTLSHLFLTNDPIGTTFTVCEGYYFQ